MFKNDRQRRKAERRNRFILVDSPARAQLTAKLMLSVIRTTHPELDRIEKAIGDLIEAAYFEGVKDALDSEDGRELQPHPVV